MSPPSLAGAGVLVTRPRHQARALEAAIAAAGGRNLPFPVMTIAGRPAADVAADLAALPPADIVVFVSSNAVDHGLAAAPPGAAIAAIGRATADALAAAGRTATIVPAAGFDSEALLAEPGLADVRGQRVRIVRGDGGRELLGAELAARGAAVDYVSVYERRPARPDAAALATVDRAFAAGDIAFVLAMSVASLEFLLELLPPAARAALPGSRLVTPSSRVIQTARTALPGMQALLAAGPGPDDLVAAMLGRAATADGRPDG